MARLYGYCYDKEGKFTEIIPIPEKPVYEKQTFYRYEMKEVVTEEKLCELHQSIKDGTYEGEESPIPAYDCPDCVMKNVTYENVQIPYEEDVIVGYEPDIPANCTLEVCPDLIFEPVFRDGKWVKTKDYTPPVEPTKPPVSSEIEELKKQLNNVKKVLDELLIGGAM